MASNPKAEGESSELGQDSSVPNGDSAMDSNKNYVNDPSKFLCGVVEGKLRLLFILVLLGRYVSWPN